MATFGLVALEKLFELIISLIIPCVFFTIQVKIVEKLVDELFPCSLNENI